MHIPATNINTEEILALGSTNEKVHNSKVLKALIERVLQNNDNNNMNLF